MPYGICNAPQTFQGFIDEVTRGLEFCDAFIHDILIASHDEEERAEHPKTLFRRLSEYGLHISVSKCTFGVSEIDFLGFRVKSDGIYPFDDRVKVIVDFPRPKSVTQLRRFWEWLTLNVVSYERQPT